jgi:hypothetical protein
LSLKITATLTFILLLLGGTLYSLQLRIDIEKGDKAAVDKFLYLPDAKYLKTASLGYDQVVADLLWLKAVQYIGARTVSSEGYDWIYKAIDAVTTLDPKFCPVRKGSHPHHRWDRVSLSTNSLIRPLPQRMCDFMLPQLQYMFSEGL